MSKRVTLIIMLALLNVGVNLAFAENNNSTLPVNQQQQSQVSWNTNYNDALQAAQNQNKPLLLFFTGSDWCGWCKKMVQEVFDSPEFAQKVGDDFIFVEVDFPMRAPLSSTLAQQNDMLKQRYGVTGFPTIIILDPNQNFVAESGYRPGGGVAYADYLKQLMATTASS